MLRGRVKLEVVDTQSRCVTYSVEASNLFLTSGYGALRRVLAGADASIHCANYIQFGVGTKPVVLADVNLQQPILTAKPIAQVEHPIGSPYEVQMIVNLGADEGNGFTITEAGLLSVDYTLLARSVFTGVLKDEDHLFRFTWTVASK
jgi:hypothetical protein